ncbi:MAG: hypothetical protein JO332_01230, partial [Planctomycetaceae bacterium]|nr:hypothetical protein [Planctomycetaceae bacterium]
MRRAATVVVRSAIVLLLVAAALDVPLPRRSGDRVRIHLVDRSQSVTLPGPKESLKLEDADAILAHDRETKASGDAVTWASFGKKGVAWESREVDASGSDLAGALEAALGNNPTEIILYTDGRADPGNALLLCRQRGVPVFVFPLGPTSVRDVRFRRISAPATVARGETYSIDVVVEATYDVSCKVGVAPDVRPVTLTAGVPALLQFPRVGAGEFGATIDADDDCPQNNRARGAVLERSEVPKVLALSAGWTLPGFDIVRADRVGNLAGFDAVVLDNVDLRPEEQKQLEDYVRQGGGLLLLGGPRSYALGRWLRTPLERLSPLQIHPDLKLAVVLGIDASGSMAGEFDSVVQTLLDTRSVFDDDDDVAGMAFGDTAKVMELPLLRKERPSGA